MRSKNTNILQAIVLFTGIVYILVGITFFISPISILQLFAQNLVENWVDLVREDELVATLYYVTRGFSALLITAGLAMILPLFDPLRYRGLIYYNGLLFPLFAAILFLSKGIRTVFMSRRLDNETQRSIMELLSSSGGHVIVLILGVIFSVLFILMLIGILITRSQAKQGIE